MAQYSIGGVGSYGSGESIATGATAVSLPVASTDGTVGDRAERALISVKTAAVWIAFSTATPTATRSFPFAVGDLIEVIGYTNLKSLTIVAQSGSGTIYVEYQR